MKFACPKCNTRYSIADEKVPPGKVLKFPCKTCGNVVRLRRKEGDANNAQVLPGDLGAPAAVSMTGDPIETTRIASVSELNKLRDQSTEPTKIGMPSAPVARAAAAAASLSALTEDGGETTRIVSIDQINTLRAAAAADEATTVGGPSHVAPVVPTAPAAAPQKQTPAEPSEWFVLISGKQRGPMTAAQVDGMLASNEIDKRTFVWKSGMANWERIASVDRFSGSSSPVSVSPMAGNQTPAAKSAQPASAQTSSAAQTMSFEESDFGRRLGDELESVDVDVVEEEFAPVDEKTQMMPQPTEGMGSQQGVSAPADEGAGFYKAHTVVVQNPQLLAPVGGPIGDSNANPLDVADAFDPRPEDKVGRATETYVGRDPLEELNDPGKLGVFDDVSQNIMLPDENSGMTELQNNPDYLQAPPGESTRVFMATAGIYKKRRNNRIAAVIAFFVVLLIAGFIVMDQQGLIVLPGMGAVYDVAGVEDPNVDRALQRTETKLSEEDLDPKKRAQLESMRRRLLDRSAEKEDKKVGSGKKKPSDKVVTTETPSGDKEGVKEEPAKTGDQAGTEQHDMAEQLFGDTRKQETGLTLAKPENIQTPNLPEGLTAEAIYKVVADNNTSMKLCYAEASRKSEKLAGKMEVELTIAPTGDVSNADIKTAQFKNSTMGTCTVKRVKTWKFPRFNGDPVTVQFPYVLQQSF